MTYLVILVLVAAAAIAKLWLQQRRQRAHLTSADDFRASLERISQQHRPSRAPGVRSARTHAPNRRRQPLDPARRAAAKQRLEARRRARVAS